MPHALSLSSDAARQLADQIAAWLRDQLDATDLDRFILGLSGGLDSAVVAGLCARAVGPGRVLGLMMPSSSIPADRDYAQLAIDAFGIRSMTIDLTSVADALFDVMPGEDDIYADILQEPQPDQAARRLQLARANVRPRTRMLTNYYVANLTRGLVVGTGNKTELMIGYFTKWGDGGADVFPITDLYKYEVREVARVIGVPQPIIDRAPSAGLWQGQTDEDEIGITYPVLDATLMAIEQGDTTGHDPEIVAKVQRMIDGSAHKRKPIPAFSRAR